MIKVVHLITLSYPLRDFYEFLSISRNFLLNEDIFYLSNL